MDSGASRRKGETYSFILFLELNYGNRREINRALAYFGEAFINGPELVQLALEILNFDFEAEEKQVVSRMKKLLEKYDNLILPLTRKSCRHAERVSNESGQEVSSRYVR